MTATHKAKLNLPTLPEEAKEAHLFPQLQRGLISIGQLCDNGCTATFTKEEVVIAQGDKAIMQGPREATTGLWLLPTTGNDTHTEQSTANTHQANNVYKLTVKRDIVQ